MVDILAFGSHPDDIEFGCGAILAKARAQGYAVVMVDLTCGEKSTNGTPAERRQEALNAAKAIGAERIFLDFVDCEIFDTYAGRLKLVEVIRKYTPRLVLAPLWQGQQNHPDHIATGSMARQACRYARFAKILPNLPVHAVAGILHYLPQIGSQAQMLIDVSENVEVWKEMMAAHKSQMQTYPYSEWALKNAAQLGGVIGKPYAQGLIAGNPIVVEDVMHVACGIREL